MNSDNVHHLHICFSRPQKNILAFLFILRIKTSPLGLVRDFIFRRNLFRFRPSIEKPYKPWGRVCPFFSNKFPDCLRVWDNTQENVWPRTGWVVSVHGVFLSAIYMSFFTTLGEVKLTLGGISFLSNSLEWKQVLNFHIHNLLRVKCDFRSVRIFLIHAHKRFSPLPWKLNLTWSKNYVNSQTFYYDVEF